LINTKSGTRNLPKLIFIYICNKEFGHNLSAIAKFVGFSRYKSVSAAARKCHWQVQHSLHLAEQINCMVTKIRDAALQMTQYCLNDYLLCGAITLDPYGYDNANFYLSTMTR
jgi:hypothetical protein